MWSGPRPRPRRRWFRQTWSARCPSCREAQRGARLISGLARASKTARPRSASPGCRARAPGQGRQAGRRQRRRDEGGDQDLRRSRDRVGGLVPGAIRRTESDLHGARRGQRDHRSRCPHHRRPGPRGHRIVADDSGALPRAERARVPGRSIAVRMPRRLPAVSSSAPTAC